jgi:predicted adenylyl cyclase CyaB
MAFEVENKFAVSDPRELERRIRAIGAEFCGVEAQTDAYFRHPHRDFLETGEMLRVRSVGQAVFVTFKGKRTKAVVKIREEIELPLVPAADAPANAIALFERLGFAIVARVHKRRSNFRFGAAGSAVMISIDDVDEPGTFVEIEWIAEADQVGQATRVIEDLQQRLELGEPVQPSYLRMMLARGAAQTGGKSVADA